MDTSYHNMTTIHAGVLGALALACAWIFLCRRQSMLLPVFAIACFVSPAQRLVLGGLDFTMTKILVLVALTRIVSRGEFRGYRWGRVDTAAAAWIGLSTVCFTITHGGEVSALVNRIGWALEMFGLYVVCRVAIRDWADVDCVARTFAWLAIPVAALFAVEFSTGRNLFAVLGGVEEITRIRDGRLRCQGAFAHPIIAGVFWASLLPLFLAARRHGKKLLLSAGLVAALFIIAATASSTPVAAVLVVVAAITLYRFRSSMSLMRWTFVAGCVAVHFYREKPVWHLLSRIDLSGGSTGYHRFALIDGAIQHFDVWALTGATDTAFLGINDITCQYVLEGLNGGMPALLAFVLTLAVAFATVGRAVRDPHLDRSRRFAAWALGAALAAHAWSFIAVSYFGQANTAFVLSLALIAALPQMRTAQPDVAPQQPRRRVTPWPVARIA